MYWKCSSVSAGHLKRALRKGLEIYKGISQNAKSLEVWLPSKDENGQWEGMLIL
jgi:hypothetical protein